MRLTAIIFSFLCLASVDGRAAIDAEPDQTLLWNEFSTVTVVDSFAVATSDQGVVVCLYDAASKTYDPVTHLLLSSRPETRKRYGNVLVVRSVIDVLYFIDLSNLPELTLLGSTAIPVEYRDFALDGENLYICAEFDGLFRYGLDNYSSVSFLDSSMIGIHYVSVEVDGDYMYAVDDYNGILTYDISGDGFGIFEDFHYMPFQVRKVTTAGSEVVVQTVRPDILIGRFQDSTLVLQDTVFAKFVPGGVFVADSLVLSVASLLSYFDMIRRTTGERYTVGFPTRVSSFDGDIHVREDGTFVLLPTADNGIYAIGLRYPFTAQFLPSYERPGPVTSLFFRENRLYTGGTRNPLDAYAVAPDGKLSKDTTYFSTLEDVRSASSLGDSAFVLYPQVESIFLLELSDSTADLDTLVEAHPDFTMGVKFNEQRVGGYRSMFGLGNAHLDIYIFNDSVDITKLDILQVGMPIMDVEIVDSLLVISTNKFELFVYRIYDDFYIEFRGAISVGTRLKDLVALPGDSALGTSSRLIGFGGGQMYLIDISDPSRPAITDSRNLPLGVNATVLEGDVLYAVGDAGIALFDARDSLPELYEFGGRGGSILAVLDGLVAVSNGNAVNLYDLSDIPLPPPVAVGEEPKEFSLSNYPNPFNPTTTIAYHINEVSRVNLKIYNLLGQEVITLVDRFLPAGNYRTEWSGRASDGRQVASGVYFYRLTVDDETESRKMVLLK